MFDDDFFSFALTTLAFSGMFLLGKKTQEKQFKKQILESMKNAEIERLKEELRRAKCQKYLQDFTS